MEDVLDQYDKPLDPNEPVVCLDEQPYQMVDDARPPERPRPANSPSRITSIAAAGHAACSWRSSRRRASGWCRPSVTASVPTSRGSYVIF